MEFPIKISVVMPVYNTPVPYLQEAVESILNQTCRDFEFLIIDDGSTGECADYLASLRNERVIIIRNPENIGITKSLNIGFRAAHGKYIARMDSDNISLSERFEKQLAFMESHPDVIVCGSRTAVIGQQSVLIKNIKMVSMEQYRVRLLFSNPGPYHPTAFFDHEKLIQHHIMYDESLPYAQDYDMWMKICQHGKICILPDVLLRYGVHPEQISNKHRKEQVCCDKVTQRKLLTQLLGNVAEEELDLHYFWSTGYYPDAVITPQAAAWYDRLLVANKQKKIYDQHLLKQYIGRIKGRLVYQTFRKNMSIFEKIRLIIRYQTLFGIQWEMLRRLIKKIKR